MATKRKKSLSAEDLEAARQRALSAGPLPDAIRREITNTWNKQSNLPRELRSLAFSQLLPSGWVITHLVPVVSRNLARRLREKNGDAALMVAKRLDEVASVVNLDVSAAVEILVQPVGRGAGSRFAGQSQLNVLRILDFGIIGLPFLAAVYANTLGITDVTSSLLSDGNLSVLESVEVARTLAVQVDGELSEGDLSEEAKLWLPSEFFTPDDLDPFSVKGIPAG